MKDIKKVTLIGLGAMGVFFAPRISEKLGADFRILADGARKERLERKGVTVNTVEAGIASADHQVPIYDIKTDVRSELFLKKSPVIFNG